MKLFKENPDHFYINGKKVGYTREDAVSFIIFKGGYIVCSYAGVMGKEAPNSPAQGHVALAKAWSLKIKAEEGLNLTQEEKEDWDFYENHIITHGKITQSAKRLVDEFISGQRAPYDYPATSTMLKGRLWSGTGIRKEKDEGSWEDKQEPSTDKVVTFWNRPSEVKELGVHLKDLFNLLGEKIEEYNFEAEDENYRPMFLSYEELLGKEDKTDYSKEYKVGGSTLKYSDFEYLRTTMHTGGPIRGPQAKEKLCIILTPDFIEKNPELRGFIPPDCDGIDSSYEARKSKGWRNSVRGEMEKGLAPSRELLRRQLGPVGAKKQIKAFYTGHGPEPVSPTTLEPGQTAGITGRTLGGFRARTQREIDDAWDDLMKKRESTGALEITFKEWLQFTENYFIEKKNLVLLKEDPNEVSSNPRTKRAKLKFDDSFAVTFILFKDYFVYAPTIKGIMHDSLAQWLVYSLDKRYLKQFEDLNPWSKSIREEGTASKEDAMTVDMAFEKMRYGLDGRNAILKTNPEVILGRIWTRQKVVSFWNHWPYVAKGADQITRFVSIFGDPKEFEYEARNMEVSYEDIVQKRSEPIGVIAPNHEVE